MRLQFDMDSDPHGRGERLRLWLIVLFFTVVILAEAAFLVLVGIALFADISHPIPR